MRGMSESYWIIVKDDGGVRSKLEVDNTFGKYCTPRIFKRKRLAEDWITRHSYKGMSYKYELEEVKHE